MSGQADAAEDDNQPLLPSWKERRRAQAAQSSTSAGADAGSSCPYLDTVQRSVLDFDMEKVCSVTLSPHHIYACLVCGKYFSGRGKQTEAYTHSVQAGHHVWLGLADGRFWCLPEGYEVHDASLDDIRFALNPTYTPATIAELGTSGKLCLDVHGAPYLPGYVGLNNLRHTDYAASVVHAMAHVQPLRDYFLLPSNYFSCTSVLVQRFGELIRRMWSPGAFKSSVSPQEFINACSDASGRRFGAGRPVEAADFLSWLLNTLHKDLSEAGCAVDVAGRPVKGSGNAGAGSSSSSAAVGSKRPHQPSSTSACQSIVACVFQGEVSVTLLASELEDEKAKEAKARREKERREREERGDHLLGTTADDGSNNADEDAFLKPTYPRTSTTPFLFLSLDLPPAPLFKDSDGGMAIPQIPVYALLNKFDGVTVTDSLRGQYRETKRYTITKVPRYLIFIVKRFKRNSFFAEKNPTIVTFPNTNLEMRPYVSLRDTTSGNSGDADMDQPMDNSSNSEGDQRDGDLPPVSSLPSMSIADLKALLARIGKPLSASQSSGMEKADLVRLVEAALADEATRRKLASRDNSASNSTKYDLVANVVHDNPPDTVAGTGSMAGTGSAVTSRTGQQALASAGIAAAAATAIGSSSSFDSKVEKTTSSAVAGGRAANAVRIAAAASDPLVRGHYKVHVEHPGTGQWYSIDDLHVDEVMPQQIGVSESYIVVYGRRAK